MWIIYRHRSFMRTVRYHHSSIFTSYVFTKPPKAPSPVVVPAWDWPLLVQPTSTTLSTCWLLIKVIFFCRLKTAETKLTQFWTNLRYSIWNHGLRITQLQSWVKAHNAWAYPHTTGLWCNKVYLKPSLSWDVSQHISVVNTDVSVHPIGPIYFLPLLPPSESCALH